MSNNYRHSGTSQDKNAMRSVINIIQIVVSLLLIGAILLQQRGGGLGAIFGGESNVYQTRRGMEKFIFVSTIILAGLFLGLATLNLFIL